MRFQAKTVVGTVSGDYYQLLLEYGDREEQQTNHRDPAGPYLLLQRQFEFSDGGKCYVEADDEAYIGHFALKLVEFSPTRLAFEIGRSDDNRVEVGFSLTAAEFEDAQPIAEVIFGMREPDFDGAATPHRPARKAAQAGESEC
jgi:hypothetical protein